MRRLSPTTLAAIVTLALAMTSGGAFYLHAHDADPPVKRRPWPKPTPPPPPSPIYHESAEKAPDEAEIEAEARTHLQRIANDLERALLDGDGGQREAAFTFIMPELIQLAPELVVRMVEAQEPGIARDTLRTELATQWVSRDPEAAVAWMKSLDERERHASAAAAVRTIGPVSAQQALAMARELGIGNDPYLERLRH
jgi:hypothetical protein